MTLTSSSCASRMISARSPCRAGACAGPPTNSRSTLSSADRKVAQAGERRVAGAEVVDRDPNTHAVERLEHPRGLLGIGDDRGLGDLEPERARRDPAGCEHLADLLRQRVVEHVGDREVDVDAGVDAAVTPLPAVAQSHVRRRAAPARPFSSSSVTVGRNSLGASSPRLGCCQRSSASTATTRVPRRGRSSAGSAAAARRA